MYNVVWAISVCMYVRQRRHVHTCLPGHHIYRELLLQQKPCNGYTSQSPYNGNCNRHCNGYWSIALQPIQQMRPLDKKQCSNDKWCSLQQVVEITATNTRYLQIHRKYKSGVEEFEQVSGIAHKNEYRRSIVDMYQNTQAPVRVLILSVLGPEWGDWRNIRV
jgi:hypothetical protein